MDRIADDDRIIEALRSCTTPPTAEQLYRLLAAWRDEARTSPTPMVSGWYEATTGRWRHTSDDPPFDLAAMPPEDQHAHGGGQ